MHEEGKEGVKEGLGMVGREFGSQERVGFFGKELERVDLLGRESRESQERLSCLEECEGWVGEDTTTIGNDGN